MPNTVRSMTLAIAGCLLLLATLYVSDPAAPLAVLAVAVGFVVIASWQPTVVLGATAATLPLYHHPVQAGELAIAPSELLLVACCVGTVANVLTRGISDQRGLSGIWQLLLAGFQRLNTPFGRVALVSLGLLALLGGALLAAIDNTEARAAGLRELRWTLVEPLVFIVLLLWHVKRPVERVFIAGAFLLGGLGVAVWGLTDALSGAGVAAGGVTRISGPFPHPNAFALYVLRPVALAIGLLTLTRSRSLPAWLACGVGGAALALSFSRSAALGLIVAGIVLWPWLAPRIRFVALAGAGVLALALTVVARDRAIGGSGQDSLALRSDIWRSGLAMIRDRPLAGYGPDQFLYTYSPRYVDPAAWAERFTSHGHNLLIDAWVRLGIIGAVCVVLTLTLTAWSASRVARAAGTRSIDPLAAAATVALAAAAAQGLVDNGYFVHDLAMSAWILAWLAWSAPGRQR